MIKKNRVLTPGPTSILPEAQFAQAMAVMHHRTETFEAMFRSVQDSLKRMYKTADDVLIFASSGTGAMEACVVNSLNPGDKAVVVNAGKFGERWGRLCRTFGAETIEITVPWGESVALDAVERAFGQAGGAARALFVQGCETSTGALADLKALAGLARTQKDCLFVADAITHLGANELRTAEWGVDLCVCGSQKALAMPPGLASISVSERAWQRAESVKTPRFYFSFLHERKAQRQSTTAWTPAISLVAAAQASLAWIESLPGGVDGLVRNAEVLARTTRAGVKALGLGVLAKSPANAVTAVRMPSGVNSKLVVKGLKERFGAVIADGQDDFKGKIFRLAHLGYTDYLDCVGVMAGVEQILLETGNIKELGAGVSAMQREYRAAGTQG